MHIYYFKNQQQFLSFQSYYQPFLHHIYYKILHYYPKYYLYGQLLIFQYNIFQIMDKFRHTNLNTNFVNINHPNNFIINNQTTKKIEHYVFKLTDIIGKGNFSQVYKGIDQRTGQVVAIKVVQLSRIKTQALVQLLYSEIQILRQLKHPNILNCHEVFTSINNCYIITEFCNEGDLQTKIRQRGSMQQRQISKMIYQIYQGLKYLGQKNIVHRDFKIANILFNKGVAKIADFGFAKKTKQKFKDINIGSPIYMSPQGIRENIYGPKTDVWAFGVMIYQILHGNTPLNFCKTSQQIKYHIIFPLRMESMNQFLSYEIKDLIIRCLQIDERKRISMNEIELTLYMRRLYQQFRQVNPVMFVNNNKTNYLNLQNRNSYASTQQSNVTNNSSNMLIVQNNGMLQYMIPQQFGNQQGGEQYLIQNKKRYYVNEQDGLMNEDGRKRIITFNKNNNSFKNLPYEQNNHTQSMIIKRRGISVQNPNQNIIKLVNTHSNRQLVNIRQSKKVKILHINSIITFQQCIQLLHYCRLIYKIIILLIQNRQILNTQVINIYTNWLFDTFDQIQWKLPNNIKFDSDKQRAGIRQKKLKEVLSQYYKKYHTELTTKNYIETQLKLMQQVSISLMRTIDGILINKIGNKLQLIILQHYLFFFYETNLILQKCLKVNNYRQFHQECGIEPFLSIKKQNFNQAMYNSLKFKFQNYI